MASSDFLGEIIDNDGLMQFRAKIGTDSDAIPYEKGVKGGSAKIGLAVTMTGNMTVGLADDGEEVVGRLVLVEPDNLVSVIVRAKRMKMKPADSQTFVLGRGIVGAQKSATDTAPGYIRSAVAPADPLVADAAASTAIEELDASRGTRIIDATAATPWVQLGYN